MLPVYDFDSDEFDRAVAAAGRAAFHETPAAGYPVFYSDADGLEAMELPDRRRFEICRIPGAPSGSNYEIVRELKVRAA